jgi:hypothetical protein
MREEVTVTIDGEIRNGPHPAWTTTPNQKIARRGLTDEAALCSMS